MVKRTKREVRIKVQCVGCKATRDVGATESARLSRDRDLPICAECSMPMVPMSVSGYPPISTREEP